VWALGLSPWSQVHGNVTLCFQSGQVSTGLTFDLVHQRDDFLREVSRVNRVLPVGSRMLHHGQEIEPLASDVDQVQRQLSVRRVAQSTVEEGARESSQNDHLIWMEV